MAIIALLNKLDQAFIMKARRLFSTYYVRSKLNKKQKRKKT